jgi:hypothetical protein
MLILGRDDTEAGKLCRANYVGPKLELTDLQKPRRLCQAILETIEVTKSGSSGPGAVAWKTFVVRCMVLDRADIKPDPSMAR